jgi:aspartate-semialdehyde dehydrogenase
MDKILEGIHLMNYNAINISKGLDTIHKQILINLDKVEHNDSKLKDNQKRMDEAAKVVTKPNCICNIIIVVLLGLIGYLVVKLVWFSDTP